MDSKSKGFLTCQWAMCTTPGFRLSFQPAVPRFWATNLGTANPIDLTKSQQKPTDPTKKPTKCQQILQKANKSEQKPTKANKSEQKPTKANKFSQKISGPRNPLIRLNRNPGAEYSVLPSAMKPMRSQQFTRLLGLLSEDSYQTYYREPYDFSCVVDRFFLVTTKTDGALKDTMKGFLIKGPQILYLFCVS